jgi:hypothetical protein
LLPKRQPLQEVKSNERLRAKAMSDIKEFYKTIADYLSIADGELKLEVIQCFRCIVLGGQHLPILLSDTETAKYKKCKVPITDTAFNQLILRESFIVNLIARQFTDSVKDLVDDFVDGKEYSLEHSLEHSLLISQSIPSSSSRITHRPFDRQSTSNGISQVYTHRKNTGVVDDPIENLTGLTDSGSNLNGVAITLTDDSYIKSIEVKEHEHDQQGHELHCSLKQQIASDLLCLCVDLAADDKNAEVMITMDVCDSVIKFLKFVGDMNFRDTGVTSAIDALWVLLVAHIDKSQSQSCDGLDSFQLESKEDCSSAFKDLNGALNQAAAISVLHGLLMSLMHDGFKVADKELRNGVLTVLTLLAESPSSHIHFTEKGLLNDLIYSACCAECSRRNCIWLHQHPQSSFSPRIFATSSEHDLVFKRGLWIMISTLLQHNDLKSLKCVGSSPFLLSLLLYIEYDTLSITEQSRDDELLRGKLPSESNPDIFSKTKESENGCDNRETHTMQSKREMRRTSVGLDDQSSFGRMPRVRLLELQALAATCLSDLAPKLLEEFILLEGPLRVYKVAVHYGHSSDNDHMSMIGSLVMLLNKAIKHSEFVKNILQEQNAVDFFLYISEKSKDEMTRAHAVHSIALLCSSSVSQDQFRNSLGIKFLVLTMKRYTELKRPLVGLVSGPKIPDMCAAEDVSVLL